MTYGAQRQSLPRPERAAGAQRVWPLQAPSLPEGVLPAWGAQVWRLH